ncbi:hypothetical protein BU15DRAFT_82442 [Melanogaster broomeanus]|nr:hypothetical protein BU15DRAFT_82442 [Melanogaster broomeanus]
MAAYLLQMPFQGKQDAPKIDGKVSSQLPRFLEDVDLLGTTADLEEAEVWEYLPSASGNDWDAFIAEVKKLYPGYKGLASQPVEVHQTIQDVVDSASDRDPAETSMESTLAIVQYHPFNRLRGEGCQQVRVSKVCSDDHQKAAEMGVLTLDDLSNDWGGGRKVPAFSVMPVDKSFDARAPSSSILYPCIMQPIPVHPFLFLYRSICVPHQIIIPKVCSMPEPLAEEPHIIPQIFEDPTHVLPSVSFLLLPPQAPLSLGSLSRPSQKSLAKVCNKSPEQFSQELHEQ